MIIIKDVFSNLKNRFFSRNSFARDTSLVAMGSIVSQIINIVTIPLLTRFYKPEEFGLLALFIAITSIFATIATLRYESTILLPKDDSESQSLVLLSVILSIIMGLLGLFTLWISPVEILVKLGVGRLGEWLLLAILAGVATAIITTGIVLLNRNRAYKRMAQLRILQNMLIAIVGIGFGFYGFDDGLLVAQVVSLLIVAAIVVMSIIRVVPFVGVNPLWVMAKTHKSAPAYLLPTALLDVVSLQLPVLLITTWFSIEAAGQFNMAWRILALPMSLIGGAIGQVFFQRFSQAWPNKEIARNILVKAWVVLALVGIFPTILIMGYGEFIFSFVLGSEWLESGKFAAIIAPMLFGMLISSSTSTSFLVIGLQKYSLLFGVSVVTYRTLCLAIGYYCRDLYLGLTLLTISEIIQMLMYQRLAWSRLR